MIVLALDTALQSCSGAIMSGGEILARRRFPLEKGHAEHLAPMVAQLFEDAKIPVKALDRVGVIIGPGGFTGVRVGLAFARALVLGTRTQIVGLNSLSVLAAMVKSEELVAPLIDARRGQVYAALYAAGGAEILAPFVAVPEEAKRRLADKVGFGGVQLTGTGARLLGERPANWTHHQSDGQIDPLMAARLTAAASISQSLPAPLYLRAPDAKKSGPSLFENTIPV